MIANDIERRLKELRRNRIVGDKSANCDFQQSDIKRILPHRNPMLLIDYIDLIEPETGFIRGGRRVPVDDPVFEGHFPEVPIYPGTSVVEMIGQLSLCLYHFVRNQTREINSDATMVNLRATKIIGAHFLAPIAPGDKVEIEARGIDDDGFFARAEGQAIVNGSICCVSIGEVCFLD